jgi:hypothetical protein
MRSAPRGLERFDRAAVPRRSRVKPMTSFPLLPPELVGLAVAYSEAEHVECAGRVHLELGEGNRVRTEISARRELATRGGGKIFPFLSLSTPVANPAS